MKENILKKFTNYVKFDTQSMDGSTTQPSTLKQRKLGEFLVEELHSMGVENAYIDEYGYVYATIKSNVGSTNSLGLIAHMDTSDEASGKDVNPKVINNYDGSIIVLNEALGLKLDPKEFNYLNNQIGHELITTDGTTLLGADDKAGITIIMEVVKNIINNNLPHPNLIITFTPDEEVGKGTDNFNFEHCPCDFGYTCDGGAVGTIDFENFN